MKRWLNATLAVAMLGAAACSARCEKQSPCAASGSASPVIDRILQSGQLRVGMSGDQPPLNATAKDGKLIGFDVDLANTLAGAMGVQATLVRMQFSKLLPALEAGELDMVISSLTMTPERNLHVAFAGPYLITGMSVLAKKSTINKLNELEEIDASKLSFAALRGSTAEKFAEQVTPKAKLVTVDTLDEGVALVRKGKVDALLADHPYCKFAVREYENDDFATLDTPFTFEPLGIALPANDPLLVNWTDNTLEGLEGSGIMLDTMYHWFREDAWAGKLH